MGFRSLLCFLGNFLPQAVFLTFSSLIYSTDLFWSLTVGLLLTYTEGVTDKNSLVCPEKMGTLRGVVCGTLNSPHILACCGD